MERDIYLLAFPVTWATAECAVIWIIGFGEAAWPLWHLVCVGNNKCPVFTCLGRNVFRRCFWYGGVDDTLCIGFIYVCNKVTVRIFLLGLVSLNSCHFGGFSEKWSKGNEVDKMSTDECAHLYFILPSCCNSKKTILGGGTATVNELALGILSSIVLFAVLQK